MRLSEGEIASMLSVIQPLAIRLLVEDDYQFNEQEEKTLRAIVEQADKADFSAVAWGDIREASNLSYHEMALLWHWYRRDLTRRDSPDLITEIENWLKDN